MNMLTTTDDILLKCVVYCRLCCLEITLFNQPESLYTVETKIPFCKVQKMCYQ